MRVESTKREGEWKVWITPEEVNELVDAAAGRSHQHKCAVLPGTRVRQIVHEAAEEAAENAEHGRSEDWHKVSSHDLRRYYAHHLLVRKRVNPGVVMQNGGWETKTQSSPTSTNQRPKPSTPRWRLCFND